MSLVQVVDVINGKNVIGEFDQILEIKNAYAAYEMADSADPYSIDDLLKIQDTMMFGLVEKPGFRDHKVAIFDGDAPIYVTPESKNVLDMISDLLNWLKTSDEHPLIKSSIFHYQFEHIHPFPDGNGRMGRLWHSMILSRWKDILESEIRKYQSEYYEVIDQCNKSEDCTEFIRYCLKITEKALENLTRIDGNENISILLNVMSDEPMSATEIMAVLRFNNKTYFRNNYLDPALASGVIEMTVPDKPKSPRQRYKRSNNA